MNIQTFTSTFPEVFNTIIIPISLIVILIICATQLVKYFHSTDAVLKKKLEVHTFQSFFIFLAIFGVWAIANNSLQSVAQSFSQVQHSFGTSFMTNTSGFSNRAAVIDSVTNSPVSVQGVDFGTGGNVDVAFTSQGFTLNFDAFTKAVSVKTEKGDAYDTVTVKLLKNGKPVTMDIEARNNASRDMSYDVNVFDQAGNASTLGVAVASNADVSFSNVGPGSGVNISSITSTDPDSGATTDVQVTTRSDGTMQIDSVVVDTDGTATQQGYYGQTNEDGSVTISLEGYNGKLTAVAEVTGVTYGPSGSVIGVTGTAVTATGVVIGDISESPHYDAIAAAFAITNTDPTPVQSPDTPVAPIDTTPSSDDSSLTGVIGDIMDGIVGQFDALFGDDTTSDTPTTDTPTTDTADTTSSDTSSTDATAGTDASSDGDGLGIW